MLSHIFVSVSDFDRALAFYQPLMAALGHEPRFCEPDLPWAGWHSAGGQRPYFVICHPHNGAAHDPGNGPMTAFTAPSRAVVDAVYGAALQQGAVSEGPPGLRPHYHPNYYGAYFRDPDGNKLCVVCHDPV
ncbi:VOC family protein [Hydrogenophaga sp.]|uniref:VOC family protein n=1 Tax=Hydrogenophaga sp. TaxID=1904254 RepID=UPI003568A425